MRRLKHVQSPAMNKTKKMYQVNASQPNSPKPSLQSPEVSISFPVSLNSTIPKLAATQGSKDSVSLTCVTEETQTVVSRLSKHVPFSLLILFIRKYK